MSDSLLENAPCGFLCVDDDGTILYVNRTLLGMLDEDAAALVGRPIDVVLTPGARIFYQTHVFPLLRANESLGELYLALRCRDGMQVPVLLNASRRIAEGKAVNDWVVVPMRRRYEFEDQLQAARDEAERATEAKTRLLSIVSHDIRSPLNAMSLGIELLASEALGPLSAEQRRVLDRMARTGTHANRLVGDLLKYATLQAHAETLDVEVVQLGQVFEEIRDLFQDRARRSGLHLEVEPCPEVTVLADGRRLNQVLANLLDNAIEHTPEDGTVSVTCRVHPDHAGIEVRDTGCGISEDHLDEIFEPFVQLPSKRVRGEGGVGLGLAISREFVRAMGGEITVESTVSYGSTFRIRLPAPQA